MLLPPPPPPPPFPRAPTPPPSHRPTHRPSPLPSQAFYVAFGAVLYDFSTLPQSMWTLILIILGEFDFESLQQANQALGPLLFITFVLFVFFILVNMFIAILGEAHESVSKKALEEPDEFIRMMRHGWRRRLAALRRQKNKGADDVQQLAAQLEAEQDRGGGDSERRAAATACRAAEAMAEGAFGAGANGGLDADGLAKMKAGSRSQLLRSADAGTLLQALQAGSDGADVPFAPEGGEDVGGGGGRSSGGPLVGLKVPLAEQLGARVDSMQEEQEAALAWLKRNHDQVTSRQSHRLHHHHHHTHHHHHHHHHHRLLSHHCPHRNHDQMAEKLALLTEATFTISNMLAAGGGANLDSFADAVAEEGVEVKRAGSFAGAPAAASGATTPRGTGRAGGLSCALRGVGCAAREDGVGTSFGGVSGRRNSKDEG